MLRMDGKDMSFAGYSSSKMTSDSGALRDLDLALPSSQGEVSPADVVAHDASNPEQLLVAAQAQPHGPFPSSAIKPEVPSQINREVDVHDDNHIESLSSNTLLEKRKKDRRRKDIGTSVLVSSSIAKPRKKRKQMGREIYVPRAAVEPPFSLVEAATFLPRIVAEVLSCLFFRSSYERCRAPNLTECSPESICLMALQQKSDKGSTLLFEVDPIWQT